MSICAIIAQAAQVFLLCRPAVSVSGPLRRLYQAWLAVSRSVPCISVVLQQAAILTACPGLGIVGEHAPVILLRYTYCSPLGIHIWGFSSRSCRSYEFRERLPFHRKSTTVRRISLCLDLLGVLWRCMLGPCPYIPVSYALCEFR
ncbi:hypothetical protein DAEQUDRAFT_252158 [Daedalea quercina L-15889]|uniref:Secreted protein n=1 Tax=Daedalea quercina L-15889 TaxID=1314783 RepID=A0A165QP54_9APHY|nr:hypothetical protein DAEQUDRAFT_252158 [Daedalea quercina L-15889]